MTQKTISIEQVTDFSRVKIRAKRFWLGDAVLTFPQRQLGINNFAVASARTEPRGAEDITAAERGKRSRERRRTADEMARRTGRA